MSSHHFFSSMSAIRHQNAALRCGRHLPSAIEEPLGLGLKWSERFWNCCIKQSVHYWSHHPLSYPSKIRSQNWILIRSILRPYFFFLRFIYFTLDISWPTKNQHLCLRLSQVSELFRKKYRSRLFLQNKINRKEKISTIFFSDNVSKMSK